MNASDLVAILTDEPQTIAQLARKLGVPRANVVSMIATLKRNDGCREVIIDNGHGRMVRAFALPKKKSTVVKERGEYVPGPGPLRYEPRDIRAVRLSGFGWVQE